MSPTSSSVLVIEAHPMMREALRTAIANEPGLRIAIPASHAPLAASLLIPIKPDAILLASTPDLILLAFGNPGTDELEALSVLRQALPGTPILALTTDEVPGQEQAALQRGAHAVLTKSAPRTAIIHRLLELCTKA